jgi:hypothetical protein
MSGLGNQNNIQPCPCTTCPSTIFIFDNVAYQNAANTVYEKQQEYNAREKTIRTGKKYRFPNDYERMQALLGRYGRAPACQRQ